MKYVTVSGAFQTNATRERLDEEFDRVADRLIALEDGTLVDSTLSADFGRARMLIEVTIATDAPVAGAERIGFEYIDRAINETVGFDGVHNTSRQAALV